MRGTRTMTNNKKFNSNPDLPKTTPAKTKVRVTLIHETETGEFREEAFLEEEVTSIKSFKTHDTILDADNYIIEKIHLGTTSVFSFEDGDFTYYKKAKQSND